MVMPISNVASIMRDVSSAFGSMPPTMAAARHRRRRAEGHNAPSTPRPSRSTRAPLPSWLRSSAPAPPAHSLLPSRLHRRLRLAQLTASTDPSRISRQSGPNQRPVRAVHSRTRSRYSVPQRKLRPCIFRSARICRSGGRRGAASPAVYAAPAAHTRAATADVPVAVNASAAL